MATMRSPLCTATPPTAMSRGATAPAADSRTCSSWRPLKSNTASYSTCTAAPRGCGVALGVAVDVRGADGGPSRSPWPSPHREAATPPTGPRVVARFVVFGVPARNALNLANMARGRFAHGGTGRSLLQLCLHHHAMALIAWGFCAPSTVNHAPTLLPARRFSAAFAKASRTKCGIDLTVSSEPHRVGRCILRSAFTAQSR